MGRAPCCDKTNVKKGPWSPEEDAKLKAYIEENGTGGNWIALPHKIGLKRCGKSCRLRWLNYLRPNIKHGDFTPEEDNIICSLYISIGSRWSIIAAQLPGRTDNDVKNYWNTKLKKRLLGRRRDPPRSPHNPIDSQDHKESSNDTNDSSQNLSASALERIQLCMQLQGIQLPFYYHPNNPLLLHNKIGNANQTQLDNSMINGTMTELCSNPSVPINSITEGVMERFESSGLHGLDDLNGLSSPNSSVANLSVNAVEAELRGLIYGEESKVSDETCMRQGGEGIESMDWWNNYEDKSPLSSWAYSPDPNSMLQDFVSSYDL